MIERVAIIGTGLIGSSLGLGLQEIEPIQEIIGIDRNAEHLAEAKTIGAIDRQADLKPGVQGVDLVVLAVPVGAICDLATKVGPYLASETIVTDVGSTKAKVVNKLEAKLNQANFIGGHPMAGSEVSGPAGADKYLFENAIYVLTQTKNTNLKALNQLKSLVSKLGAQTLTLAPKQHDRIVSVTSHLPHAAAVSLMGVITDYESEEELISSLIAGGFRDTTRIAAGEPVMWKDIFLNNKESVVAAIDSLIANLTELKELITQDKASELEQKLLASKEARDRLPMQKKGLLPTNYELILTLPDKPLAIGDMATLLGEAGINIQDIEVLKVREEAGSIRLSFSQEKEQKQAYQLLSSAGYQVVKRDS